MTGLVGDVMAAATTVKVNDAVDPLLARLSCSSTSAAQTAVRDRVLDESVQAFSQGAADVGLGLVLLVSAGAIASGAFGLGDLALFTAYLGWLAFLPRMIGRVLAASQAGRCGVRPHAHARRRRARAEHRQGPRICRSGTGDVASGRRSNAPNGSRSNGSTSSA